MAAPYLIVGLGGDSNAYNGKFGLIDGSDDGGARIFRYSRIEEGNTVLAANEPLDVFNGYGGTALQPWIGGTLALCRALRDGGHLPSTHDILIVPRALGGAAFQSSGGIGPWAAGQSGQIEFIAALQQAVALHPKNRIWFIDWNHGANDQAGIYQDHFTTLVTNVSNAVPTAKFAPWLVTGLPKNWLDANPPFPGDLTDAALRAAPTYLPNAIYINVDGLTAIDTSNAQIHHPAVHHRGGTNNAPGNVGEVIAFAASIAGMKLAALTGASARPFRTRMSWI